MQILPYSTVHFYAIVLLVVSSMVSTAARATDLMIQLNKQAHCEEKHLATPFPEQSS